jgi:hypothetical protein
VCLSSAYRSGNTNATHSRELNGITISHVFSFRVLTGVPVSSLKELLRQRLVECGWREELKTYCKGATVLTFTLNLESTGMPVDSNPHCPFG